MGCWNCKPKYCMYCRYWIMTEKKKGKAWDKCKLDDNKTTTPLSTCKNFERETLATIVEDCCG